MKFSKIERLTFVVEAETRLDCVVNTIPTIYAQREATALVEKRDKLRQEKWALLREIESKLHEHNLLEEFCQD